MSADDFSAVLWQPGMPLVEQGATGRKTAQLVDQAHGHVIPRPDGWRATCAGPVGCWTCHLEKLVYESKLNIFIDQGMVLKPGDKVLLIAPDSLPPKVAREHTAMLRRRFPDTEFTIVAGYTGIQIASTNV